MNTRKATVALLTVIAVLLALNFVAEGSRSAEAQVRGGDGEPYIVRWIARNESGFYRVWSDSQVDRWNRLPMDGSCEDIQFVNVTIPPADHPFPVVDANWADEMRNTFVITFADGRVDFVETEGANHIHCTIAGQGSAPFCIGDTDRSGVTDFQDIINVLEDWGECELTKGR